MRLFSAVLGLSVLLSAIGPATAQTTVRWASQGDALTYDPHAQNETPTIAALLQVYETLIRRDPDLNLEGALAESWENVDALTWRFKLRQGVTFHDGTPFTAEDVAFSIRRAQSENSDYKVYVETIEEIAVIDDHTVEFKTAVPTPLMASNLTTVYILSKNWAEANDVTDVHNAAAGEENFAVRNANGTGPFKLKLREPDIRTVLERNDAWWGLERYPHNIDEIVYTPIANKSTRVAALLSGELDFVLDPPLNDLPRIQRNPNLKVKTTPQTRTIFFGMDQGRAELRRSDIKGKNPFADKRVRQAVYQAINIEAIKRTIMRGQAVPAGMLAPPRVNGYSEDLDQRLPYDVDGAKALMAEAGYEDGFDVTLDCPNNRYINDEAICQAAIGMLERIGIRAALDAQPKSLHFPKVLNRTTDFYLLGWGIPTLDSEYVFSYLYETGGSWNATGYSKPPLDKMIAQVTQETDVEKRNALIAETWEQVLDDIVYVPLHYQVITWAMAKNFDMPIMVDDMPRFYWASKQ